MNIEQMKKLKIETQNKILELVKEFETKTSLSVDAIDTIINIEISGKRTTQNVKLEVQL